MQTDAKIKQINTKKINKEIDKSKRLQWITIFEQKLNPKVNI